MIAGIKKSVEFILFSSIFISACAVVFCMETNILLGVPFNHFSFYCFVFGATLLQYNFHYLAKRVAIGTSERLAWSKRNRTYHLPLIMSGILLVIFSLFGFELEHFIILAFLGFIAFLYSFPFLPFGEKKRIKDYGLLKIITLSLLWTIVTVWFPVADENVDLLLLIFIFAKRFVFMFILCLLFDVRDIEIDLQQNIHTFPVILGRRRSYVVSYLLLILFATLSVLQYFYVPQTGFLIAMLISAMLTFFIIEITKKNNSDFVYLAGIDGMMMVQAILVFLFSFKI